ncbi:hypothetical protein B0T26DRAFT_746997 [Lasiosphaeria miniovina]|uniref:Uncharacterized protein n=1 Tax=Lasiosphaeria miniovina TaxID=1954250 RepID=A0AA40EB92_9PEZI|nr:uncharacterized protein B0T26DRAFT_746997 [Lasiosphaeria miniovina]KAK0735184.1 hypothetical protein B0T26DRAFT_746997 [Lasiosphaeria miniovina]
MAIFKRIKGLEVTIKVNGATAREYDNPDAVQQVPKDLKDFDIANPVIGRTKAPYVLKYIDAKLGALFSLGVYKSANCKPRIHHIVDTDDLNLGLRHDINRGTT